MKLHHLPSITLLTSVWRVQHLDPGSKALTYMTFPLITHEFIRKEQLYGKYNAFP